MITLQAPWWLLLLLAPPIIHRFAPARRESDAAIKVPFFEKLLEITGEKAQQAAIIRRRKHIQTITLTIAWILLVISMSQPVLLGNVVETKETGRDLMVAVDLSQSMKTVDFPDPSGVKIERWSALKQLMLTFSQERKGDRLGLIAFGSGAYLQIPFTNQRDTWAQLLTSLHTEVAGPATAIGDAIGLSIRAFKNSTAPQRVMILVTDGSDTASSLPPIEAAKVAKANNIIIYTIAMGDPKTKGDEKKIDVGTLQKVADITGGKSYLAIDTNALNTVLADINKIVPSTFKTKAFQPVTLLYPYLLFIGIAAFLLLWIGLIIYSLLRIKGASRHA